MSTEQASGTLAGPSPAEAAHCILKKSKLRPALAIVLGSGFSSVLAKCTVVYEVPYSEIPGFPKPTVAGHQGKLCLCFLAKTPIVVLSGRAHYYEGHSMETVTFAMRVLAAMGIKAVLLTNAAGGIASKFKCGDFMALTDHINFMGVNPLRGWVSEQLPRFVDLTDTYDPQLVRFLKKAAEKAKARFSTGVYLAVSGPSYETPARNSCVRETRRGCRGHEHRARGYHRAAVRAAGRRAVVHHESCGGTWRGKTVAPGSARRGRESQTYRRAVAGTFHPTLWRILSKRVWSRRR